MLFYIDNILFQKWIRQQAYNPLISPLLLYVWLVKINYGLSKYNF